MKLAAVTVLFTAFVSCTMPPTSSVSPSPFIASQSAELRIQLDLLMSEHVMIVAKESAAAINHSDAYPGYTALLATNANELERLFRYAVGNTAATRFSTAWRLWNEGLVDYAIGVATHDSDKAAAVGLNLSEKAVPQLTAELADLGLGHADDYHSSLTNELASLRETIDGEGAHHYAATYTSLNSALSTATAIGDALAAQIAVRFPDKFPGDQTAPGVVKRVVVNVLMLERAYLVTMATDAIAGGRADETTQALAAVSSNLDFMFAQLSNTQARQAWVDEMSSIQRYVTSGDANSKNALTQSYVSRLASAAAISPALVSDQVNATIRVIDDQRFKNFDDVARDDRAAATSMQPIANAL